MPVADWLPSWLAKHRARFPRNDWPEGRALILEVERWEKAFVWDQVSELTAEAASLRMLKRGGPRKWKHHLPAILDIIHKTRQQGSGPPEVNFADQVAVKRLELERRKRWDGLPEHERARIRELAYVVMPMFRGLKNGASAILPWCLEEAERSEAERERGELLPIFEEHAT